jgi:hypothetical protein
VPVLGNAGISISASLVPKKVRLVSELASGARTRTVAPQQDEPPIDTELNPRPSRCPALPLNVTCATSPEFGIDTVVDEPPIVIESVTIAARAPPPIEPASKTTNTSTSSLLSLRRIP